MSKPPKPFLREYLPFLMFKSHALMTRQLDDIYRQKGFTTAEWRILSTLDDAGAGQGLSINELTDGVELPQPTVSRWTNKLLEKGLLRRMEHKDDLRHTLVKLSPKGRKSAKMLIDLAYLHQTEVASLFSNADVRRLITMLQELTKGLEEESSRSKKHGQRRLI